MPRLELVRVVVILACLGLSASPSIAQTTTSSIEGTVTDATGAVIQGAEVTARGATLAAERRTTTDAKGVYRLAALPAGTYTVSVAFAGLVTRTAALEVTLNRVVTFDATLEVGGVQETIAVSAPALDLSTSATTTTITPREITELPVNGRNYLDLLQLVPGVAINRQVDPNTDRSNPVLGERSGNNNFLIDGQSNKDTVNGGPAQQFNQETIAEFQVLTSGYKAEFGQASGAIVNVITKSGSNLLNGVGSLFFRDDALDASNSLDQTRTEPLPLRRYDSSLALGGPLVKDKMFFFGSAERISEKRQLDFKYPDTGNQVVNRLLREQEAPYDVPTHLSETRAFVKFDERLGRHQLSEQVNFTDGSKPELPAAVVGQQPALGAQRYGYHAVARRDRRHGAARQSDQPLRGHASRGAPARRERNASVADRSDRVDALQSVRLAVHHEHLPDLRQPADGHVRQPADAAEPRSGVHRVQRQRGQTVCRSRSEVRDELPAHQSRWRRCAAAAESAVCQHRRFRAARRRHRRSVSARRRRRSFASRRRDPPGNNYTAFFGQDDWRLRDNLTVNLGLRWEYDSEFEAKDNFAPRVGASWSVTPKTVVRGNFGVYYDQFRLGLARNVPAYGGTDQRNVQYLVFPRCSTARRRSCRASRC
jgi:hypothetical protein